jgi:N-acetyl-anhydromuramyl-L-alanine amidase AmpD
MTNWTSDDIARIIISVGQQMGISPRGIVIGLATGLVESNLTVYGNAEVPGSLSLPHDAVGSDGFSVGVQQQQVVDDGNGWWWGPVEVCQDPTSSTRLFFGRLAKLDYNNNGPDTPGSYAQAVQQSAFPDRYDARMADAQAIYDRLSGGAPVPTPTPAPVDPRLAALAAVRPDFNEYGNFSANNQDRAGTPVDLWLLHTEEGDMNADALVKWMDNNGVSYHYAGSQDPVDGGVTVVDMVDTDLASWSVMNSNDRAINFCFAGSYTAWTRQDWLNKAGKAIDVAAYLAVADVLKYPKLSANVIAAPYADPPGIADHNYCTVYLKDGNNHTDVGPNFPWDVFKTSVAKYWAAANSGQPDPHPNPTPTPVYDPTTNAEQEILTQVRGRWAMLGNQTVVETLAQLRDKITGSSDADKPGVTW